ncbi:MAG: UDP-glucose 4-epimerase [Bacteroidetes bacterium]|nr:MAG: UDP-glucose 4-epimerase [Bacteroidota bacterium]
MSNKQRILVTGGAGYIGSHTIIELLSRPGFEVVSADNYSNSSSETYRRIKTITGKDVAYAEIDLCDRQAVKKLFEDFPGITGVIHFAAFKSVPESVEKPAAYYRNNLVSLINVLEACTAYGVARFIFSSSCSVYGNIGSLPVNEDTPVAAAESPYGYTKIAGEQILKDFTVAFPSLHAIALRYFNPAGAHPSGLIGEIPLNRPNNLVPVITRTAIGKQNEVVVFGDDYDTRDGTCIRDYVHVCDIAEAHVLAIDYLQKNAGAKAYDVINLGTGSGVTVLEAIKAFERVAGKPLNYRIGPRRSGDVIAIFSDSSKAHRILGWNPHHALDEMMSSAWKWELHLAK